MRHVDRLADPAGILPAVVMPGQLQMLVKLASLVEDHAAPGALDKRRWFAAHRGSERILHLFLAYRLLSTCQSVGSANETLPFALIGGGHAENEAPFVVVVATPQVNQLRAALVERVLANRANLRPVEIHDFVLKFRFNLVELSQF